MARRIHQLQLPGNNAKRRRDNDLMGSSLDNPLELLMRLGKGVRFSCSTRQQHTHIVSRRNKTVHHTVLEECNLLTRHRLGRVCQKPRRPHNRQCRSSKRRPIESPEKSNLLRIQSAPLFHQFPHLPCRNPGLHKCDLPIKCKPVVEEKVLRSASFTAADAFLHVRGIKLPFRKTELSLNRCKIHRRVIKQIKTGCNQHRSIRRKGGCRSVSCGIRRCSGKNRTKILCGPLCIPQSLPPSGDHHHIAGDRGTCRLRMKQNRIGSRYIIPLRIRCGGGERKVCERPVLQRRKELLHLHRRRSLNLRLFKTKQTQTGKSVPAADLKRTHVMTSHSGNASRNMGAHCSVVEIVTFVWGFAAKSAARPRIP